MKAVILAGGKGSRMAEEGPAISKPLLTIGQRPMLWHILKIFSAHGITEFVVCLGHLGSQITAYCADTFLDHVRLDQVGMTGDIFRNHRENEPWQITLVETGQDTQTAGRIRQVLPLVADDPAFCLTYGDGVANVDISALVKFHSRHGCLATVTAVQPPGRFGRLEFDETARVSAVTEKPPGDGYWINGGFFVLSPQIGRYLAGDNLVWEREPLENLARDGELMAWKHGGFWQSMDYPNDRLQLSAMWLDGRAPWKIWE